MNPALIGASQALEAGNLDRYEAIRDGHKHVGLEDVVEKTDANDYFNLEADSEIQIELGKFDEKPYKVSTEKAAESIVLERMVKFDKTFKLVMDHVRRMLKISHRDLNRHIHETMMGDKSEPSATLKFYNELL